MGSTSNRFATLAGGAIAVAASVLLGGCAGNLADHHPSNAELYAQYERNAYEGEMVGARATPAEADDDPVISPEALASVQHALEVTYRADFERCFEAELDRLEVQRLSAQFNLEIAVSPTGDVTETRLVEATPLDAETHPDFHAPDGVADRFEACVRAKMDAWEIEHPPESRYEHTYALELGEAW